MASFWGGIAGEISKLRSGMGNLLGVIAGDFHKGYKLDSSKVDYDSARQLYRNTHDKYKLGGGFAQPVVNTKASFMGVPEFKSDDERAHEILSVFAKSNHDLMIKTQLNSLRDGDAYVWITREDNRNKSLFPELKTRLVYNLIPPEQVKDVVLDPITNEPTEYVLVSEHEWEDDGGNQKRGTMTQKVGIGYVNTSVEGDTPPGVKVGEKLTSWDFIPIVHFKNESDEFEKYGRSEIEAIEPFIKAYHDVMLHAMQGSRMHSTPRLKLKLKDVEGFLRNNMGITDIRKFMKEGGKLSLDGNEMVILSEGDEAEFIEARSATGDAKELLKLLFFCIVDASETPEFVFGVHTPASQASVREQMPVLIRNIERKRSNVEGAWQHIARIVLAMTTKAENISLSTFETEIVWGKIDPRSGEEIANELKITVEALSIAIDKGIISHEAAVTHLSTLVATMSEYESDGKIIGEKDKILKTRLDQDRLSDSVYLQKQLDAINKRMKEGA